MRLAFGMIGLILLAKSTTAEAKFIEGVIKRSIRTEQREVIRQRTPSTPVRSPTGSKASDLDELTTYDDFGRGISLQVPANWTRMSLAATEGSGTLLVPTFQAPIDALHSGTRRISVTRVRIDPRYTPSQYLTRGIRLFHPTLRIRTSRDTAVGGLSGFSASITARGDIGRLAVLPHPDKPYAFVLWYRADSREAFTASLPAWNHVLATFTADVR